MIRHKQIKLKRGCASWRYLSPEGAPIMAYAGNIEPGPLIRALIRDLLDALSLRQGTDFRIVMACSSLVTLGGV